MRFYCSCVDDIYLVNELVLYCSVNPNEWLCLDCFEQSTSFILPSLVDDLGIDIDDLFAPEYREESR